MRISTSASGELNLRSTGLTERALHECDRCDGRCLTTGFGDRDDPPDCIDEPRRVASRETVGCVSWIVLIRNEDNDAVEYSLNGRTHHRFKCSLHTILARVQTHPTVSSVLFRMTTEVCQTVSIAVSITDPCGLDPPHHVECSWATVSGYGKDTPPFHVFFI